MIAEKFAVAGIRVTPQRLAILEYLDGNTDHPSAEDIFSAVKHRHPGISFATVYNTLETLKRVNGVRELKIDATRRRYDPNPRAHHHLICGDCGMIVDIHADYQLAVPAEVSASFDVTGNHVEFFGICHPCKKRTKGSRGNRPQANKEGLP